MTEPINCDLHELSEEILEHYEAMSRPEVEAEIAQLLDFKTLIKEIRNHHPRLENTIDDFILN